MKQKILNVNNFPILLPIGLERVVETKVRDAYHDFLKDGTRDVRRHLTCLTTLLPPEIEHMYAPNVMHAFGGLGASAQVIDQVVMDAEHHFWERDQVCINYLRDAYPRMVVTHTDNSFVDPLTTHDLSVYDILLLDMSVGTIKTPGVKEMWKNVAAGIATNDDQVVWFTDTACHKMHLNHKGYRKDFGLEDSEPTAEWYLNAYSQWLEANHGIVITAAMREAGEYYCIAKRFIGDNKRFTEIPYL